MGEYIERQSVLSAIDMSRSTHKAVGERLRINDVVWIIKNARAADVAPVVHGEWMLKHIGHGHYWECSVCHTNPCIYVTENTKYCPNCGAKMGGGKE